MCIAWCWEESSSALIIAHATSNTAKIEVKRWPNVALALPAILRDSPTPASLHTLLVLTAGINFAFVDFEPGPAW